MQSPPGAVTQIDGREYLYFVGTGYLGLQGHPEVIRAACEAAQQYGIGSANTRTAFGTTPPVLDVERRAAELFGLDDAFYFASGWLGNNILMRLLDAESGLIFIDEYSHYSVFEAAMRRSRLSAARDLSPPRPRRSSRQAEETPRAGATRRWCSATACFPPAGESLRSPSTATSCAAIRARSCCLDDAHAMAVLGENGRGTFEHAGPVAVNLPSPFGRGAGGEGGRRVAEQSVAVRPQLCPPCPALLFSGTLSKAVGGFGGIIPGSREFIDRIKSAIAVFRRRQSAAGAVAAATARAIELVMADPGLRTRLWSNVRLLKDGLRRMGFDVDDTPVPIVCLVIGTAENMQRIQRELMARGIAMAYMAAYAGLGPEGGLRIAVFATHTEEMIGQLLEELSAVV